MAEFTTRSLDLKYPVPTEGEPIRTLTLREPDIDAIEKLEDLGVFDDRPPLLDADGKPRKDEKGETLVVGLKVREIRAMVAIIGDMPEALIGKMHPLDFNRVGDLLIPLLASHTGAALVSLDSGTVTT